MKATKKILAMLLALIMILSFAACGSTAGTETEPPAQQNETPNVNEGTEEPYQLDIWMYDNGTMTDVAAVEEALSKLALEKINCTVKLHIVDGATYADKMNLEITSGTKMDLVNSAFGNKYTYYASSGVYLPLDDYLTGDYSALYDLVGHAFTDGTKINGSIYAIPVNKEKGETNGFVFNKELVEKYNFDLSTIKTYTDIEPWLEIIAENEPDITPLTISNGGIFNLLAIESEPIYYNGLVYMEKDTEDYKLKSPLEVESNVEIFRWVHKMYEKGYINKDLLTDETGSNSPARSYKFFCESMNLKPGFAAEKEPNYAGPIVCVELQDPYMPFSQSTGSMMSIPATSENPDKAMAFLNLLYTDAEVINTLVYGVEGTHYEKIDENHAKYIDNSGWANWSWAYGNQFINYLFEGEAEDKYTQFEDFNAACVPSKILGFSIDNDKTADLYNACSVVWGKYKQAICIGAIDPDEMIPQIQAELDAAGYQELMTELQSELDAWVAANK